MSRCSKVEKTLEMDPNFTIAHYELGQAFEQKRMLNEAIGEFQRAIELSGGNEVFEANLAYAYATSGRKEEATKIVKDLEDRESRHSSTDASIALIYLGLGDKD
jgi:Flp pilus assembly protein TadD